MGSVSSPPAILRRAVTAAVILLTIAAVSINAYDKKETPTGESVNRNIRCGGTGSGGQRFCFTETGQLHLSGSITAQGVTLSSGATLTLAGTDARYVNTSGDTMTGSLTIRVTNGVYSTLGLEVENTLSGAIIRASQTLASSGALTWEGAGSGASLYVGDDFDGAGLSDCDGATSALLWDATAKRFSCDTTAGTAYTAGQGLTITSTAFSVNPSLTGSSLRFTTMSGQTLNIGGHTLPAGVTTKLTGTTSGNIIQGTTLSGTLVKYDQVSPRTVSFQAVGSGTAVGLAVGKVSFLVPRNMSGYNLVYFRADVNKTGTTGTQTMNMTNTAKANRSFFTTAPTIDSAEASTTTAAAPWVINAATRDVGGGDLLLFNITGLHTTPAQGTTVELEFRKP
jgi:hypothetical protein